MAWGADHRRTLPWRETRDPWCILVSEIMLQQTQADRVVPYYEAFVGAFPTPQACAAAPVGDVVRLWSGLGYNRRALNLHRAATVITAEHGGRVPHDDGALRALPGVGVYTARAVRAFAFADPVAPVDTNVMRILSRCVSGETRSVAETQRLADALVPSDDAWAFNQTVFDLGALVCTGTRPACGICPLNRQCVWRRRGRPDPDPWRASPSARPQSRFAGSTRQGRGRLVDALRRGVVTPEGLALACGWPDDPARAHDVAAALVAEGFAHWSTGRSRVLALR
ncbi:MAG TPA: A/G-specific adenine glycosylase [Acidimicrobiales bacterium]|nr:A/G-specific adenine glycosylase [Acidimicrobiales bacterium]